MQPECAKVIVAFDLLSEDMTSEEISALMKVKADSCRNRGDTIILGKPITAQVSRWTLQETDQDLNRAEEAFQKLMARLLSIRERIVGLPPSIRRQVTVVLSHFETDASTGIRLAPAVLSLLAELSVSVEVRAPFYRD